MPITRRRLLQSGASLQLTGAAEKPNVLLLVTDQHRFDALGAHGNKLIRTPNLDRLATQSADFLQAVVPSPVCVPSRVSLLTGRYAHSHKNRVNYTPCDPREIFLQKMLHDAGYRTGSVGKLHYYPPTAAHAKSTGFDRVLLDDGVGHTDPYSDYVKWRKDRDPKAATPYLQVARDIRPGKNPFRGAVEYQYTPTAWTGREAAGMLRDFASSSKPFFLHASFFKPHSPYTVPEPYDSMYDGVEIPLPRKVTLEEIHKLPLPVQKQILRQPQQDMDRQRLEWIYRSYYASVSMVDREIGRILDELERSGKASNTIVIFTTDHGDQLLEHGLTGKNVFFEASVRVPFMARYPGCIRPGRYSELMETLDTVPTILDLCGMSIPPRIEGRSFAPLVCEGRGKYFPREVAFSENIIPEVITGGTLDYPFVPGQGIRGIRHPDGKMARNGRWKLNYYPGNGGELYDLQNDPGELRNLYADAGYQTQAQEMKGAILDWMITADENDQIAPRWLL